jgi:GNAT superfamily N-acetyltransferase
LVALEAGSVVGYLLLTHDFFGNGFVPLVIVSPAYQRKGIGLLLLGAAESHVRGTSFYFNEQLKSRFTATHGKSWTFPQWRY